MNANLIYVDATDRFIDKLSGVADPETKRKIIVGEFIEVFAEETRHAFVLPALYPFLWILLRFLFLQINSWIRNMTGVML